MEADFQRLGDSLDCRGPFDLVIFYHMMRSGASDADLGGDFFDRLEPERLIRYYVKRLERLGHKVMLETNIAA